MKTRNSIEFVGKSKNRIFCKYWCRDEFGFSSRISSYEYIYFNALKVYVSISILACFIAPNLALQYGLAYMESYTKIQCAGTSRYS